MANAEQTIATFIVSCVFAVFAVVALPHDALAYHDSIGASYCGDVHYTFCEDAYGYDYGDVYDGYGTGLGDMDVYVDDMFDFEYGDYRMTYEHYTVYYTSPTVYTYPTVYYTYPTTYQYTYVQRPIRYQPTPAQDFAHATREFNRDFARGAAAWNANANYYATWPL